MKGIILAAGKGTRMYPMTLPVPKPLLPVYDKPMIYYPLSTLMAAGIREVLIITPAKMKDHFRQLFGDGSRLGMKILYKEQKVQRGIADALIVGKSFIKDDPVTLILGDNIFHGGNVVEQLRSVVKEEEGAFVFGYPVEDPRAFGVLGFDEDGKISSIEEKPEHPKSNYIVPGLYHYDKEVVKIAKAVEPSKRGELEITSVNQIYLERNTLNVRKLDPKTLWMDAGNSRSLLEAANRIENTQREAGLIGSIELCAYENGWIDGTQLRWIAQDLCKTEYGKYLLSVLEQKADRS